MKSYSVLHGSQSMEIEWSRNGDDNEWNEWISVAVTNAYHNTGYFYFTPLIRHVLHLMAFLTSSLSVTPDVSFLHYDSLIADKNFKISLLVVFLIYLFIKLFFLNNWSRLCSDCHIHFIQSNQILIQQLSKIHPGWHTMQRLFLYICDNMSLRKWSIRTNIRSSYLKVIGLKLRWFKIL